MARRFESKYRISERDDVLERENQIHQDIDLRLDAIEVVADDLKEGNRADVDALIARYNEEISEKSAEIEQIVEEFDHGFTPDRITETVEKRFVSDAEIEALLTAISNLGTSKLNSATFSVHRDNTNNPHGVTAAQVGTLTTEQIDEDLEILEAALKGGVEPGLDTLAKLATALMKRVRVDQAQTFSDAEKGRARANIDAGVLSGFRNKIINGDFGIWQRGTYLAPAFGNRYLADRWNNIGVNSTVEPARIANPTPNGQLPGDPDCWHRTGVVSVAGAANASLLRQVIEDVRTLAGKKATLTFWAKAAAAVPLAFEFSQVFGSGGSVSAIVAGIGATKVNLTTQWQKFATVIDFPTVVGKTIGTDNNSSLQLSIFFEAGSNFDARTNNLGQRSGVYDVARVSLVEGDATKEDDPFSARHAQQELHLCQRYYAGTRVSAKFNATAGGQIMSVPIFWPVLMRGTPTTSTGGFSSNANATAAVGDPTDRSANLSLTSVAAGSSYFMSLSVLADIEY
jgi:hypothetical protein